MISRALHSFLLIWLSDFAGAFRSSSILPNQARTTTTATALSANWREAVEQIEQKIPSLPNVLPDQVNPDNLVQLLKDKLDVTNLGDVVAQLRQQISLPHDLPVATLREVFLDVLNDVVTSELFTQVTDEVQDFLNSNPSNPAVPLLQEINALPPSIQIAASAFLTYRVVRFVLDFGKPPPPSRPYPMNRYDATSASRYFDSRVPQMIARSLEIGLVSLKFALSVVLEKGTEEERGRELARVLTRLGPTFIKVGQSLSIRTDLLTPGYIRGLETLQDQVPAFPTEIAKQTIQDEWGKSITDILESDLSPTPIAAASLGQVYKGRLRSTGQDVAIKVQRPDIMENIALDMHLLREFGAIAKQVGNLNTDTTGTVDAWGSGFVDELDYIQEAANGEFFAEKIKETPLKDVVFTPEVIQEHTTSCVLMTSWVDGQRLDQTRSEDVTVLCSIAMNTYLTMLLELGLLRKFALHSIVVC